MKIPVKHWLKQYLGFSKKDRNAVIILCILILLVLAVNISLDYIPFNSGRDYSEYKKILEEWQNEKREAVSIKKSLFPFNPNTITESKLDSLLLPSFVKQNLINYRNAGGKFSTKEDVRKIYGMNDSIFEVINSFIQISHTSNSFNVKKQTKVKTFTGWIDPNRARLNELIQFGFNRFQASNIIEYRRKGGRFNSPADLLTIYGLDSLLYLKIAPHIHIEQFMKKPSLPPKAKSEIVKVELNSIDSAGLTQLSGIGPVFAARIIKYRNLLGGFERKKQLLEVYHFPAETFQEIQNNITVDTLNVKKIRLNFASFSELLHHPYLNKENVKLIINYRTQNGSYQSVHQILEEGLVDTTTYFLIKPYITCR